MNHEKTIERIRKLLRMAEDTSSPNEAAIAADRAARLMRKHQLDNADVVMQDLEDGDALIRSKADWSYKSIPGWLQSLAVSIAKVTDTQARIARVQGNRSTVEFAGYQPDVELAQWLTVYLYDQITQQSTAHRNECAASAHPPFEYQNSPRRYMRSFRDGICSGIREKLAEFYADGDPETADTARAMVTAKKNAIEREFGRARYKASNRSQAYSAYQNGQKAADRVNVSRGVSGRSSGPALIGKG